MRGDLRGLSKLRRDENKCDRLKLYFIYVDAFVLVFLFMGFKRIDLR